MTLSTYHLPVIFPDEAVALNYKGFQLPRQPSYHLAEYLQSPQIEAEGVHRRWGEDARKQVGDYIANNRQKDRIMRGYVPSTITTNRKNSKKPLYRSPQYEDVLGSKLYGGVVTTREGQNLVAEKLQQRIQSLNDLDASAWGSPVKQQSAVLPPPSGLETEPLDSAFVSLADAVQTGYMSPSMLDALQKSNTALVQVGPYLDPSQIAEYIRINNTLVLGIQGIIETASVYARGELEGLDEAEQKRLAKAMLKGLERQRKLLQELNKKAYYSVADKQLLLSKAQASLLPKEITSIRATPSSAVIGKLETTRPVVTPEMSEAERSRRRALPRVARQYLEAIRSPLMGVESRDTESRAIPQSALDVMPQ